MKRCEGWDDEPKADPCGSEALYDFDGKLLCGNCFTDYFYGLGAGDVVIIRILEREIEECSP